MHNNLQYEYEYEPYLNGCTCLVFLINNFPIMYIRQARDPKITNKQV